MKDQALVSIVMPAYNAERTIEASIESVINQEYDNWELIIIDDCSLDKTATVIQSFVHHPQIKYIHLEANGGVAKARNQGIRMAKGAYIAFLDSDDVWQPSKISHQVLFFEKNPQCDLHYTACSYVDQHGAAYAYRLQVPKELTYEDLLKQNLIMCSSVMIKSEVIKEHPFIGDNSYHEDYATWLNILKRGYKAMGSNVPLLIYRIDSDSKSGNKFKAAKMQWRTYSLLEVPFMKRLWVFSNYAVKNTMKYSKIFRS